LETEGKDQQIKLPLSEEQMNWHLMRKLSLFEENSKT